MPNDNYDETNMTEDEFDREWEDGVPVEVNVAFGRTVWTSLVWPSLITHETVNRVTVNEPTEYSASAQFMSVFSHLALVLNDYPESTSHVVPVVPTSIPENVG